MNIITSSQREPTDSQRMKAQNKLYVLNTKKESTGQKVSLNDRFYFLANCHILVDMNENEKNASTKCPVSLVPFSPSDERLTEESAVKPTSPMNYFSHKKGSFSPFRNFKGGSKYQPTKSDWHS